MMEVVGFLDVVLVSCSFVANLTLCSDGVDVKI